GRRLLRLGRARMATAGRLETGGRRRVPAGLQATSVPRLSPGVRLREDTARGGWVLLGPERVLQPDPIAVEILKRVDGHKDLQAIVDELVQDFSAERSLIERDVRLCLTGLAEKGLLEFQNDPPN